MIVIKLTSETWLSWDDEGYCETWDLDTALKFRDITEAGLIMGLSGFCQKFPEKRVEK